MRLMLTKFLDKIIILVVASAADSVCSSLFNTKNFLSSEFYFGLSLVMIADAMTSSNYSKLCDFSLQRHYPTVTLY